MNELPEIVISELIYCLYTSVSSLKKTFEHRHHLYNPPDTDYIGLH